jgi:protein phosphatase inhibitor 2
MDEDDEDEDAQGDARNLGDNNNDEAGPHGYNDASTRGGSSVPPVPSLPQGLDSGGQNAPITTTTKVNGIGQSGHHA